MTILTTTRLRLEPFDDAHIDGLNRVNSDPEVMRFLGRPETRDETIAVVERVKARWAEYGFSWWTFIERTSGGIVGAGCIQHLRKNSAGAPDPACPLEVGWRLRRDRWHRGLATEAAVAMTDFAFDALRAEVLCAVCRPENTASASVMKRLGMRCRGIETWYDADMTTYEITVDEWRSRTRHPGV